MKQELQVLKRYCDSLGWPTEEKSDTAFYTGVPGEQGENKILWVVSTTGLVEMSVQSGFAVDEDDGFPGVVSTMMLNLNSKMDYGFWCLESLSGKKVASVMHNQEPEDLDKQTFRNIATKLVTSCESFEKAMASNFG